MFTLAKLTSLALGILATGSAGGIITPLALGITNFFSKDGLKQEIDLRELKDTEQNISSHLTSQKERYNSALKWLESLKNFYFQKITEAFKNLLETEQKIEEKYKEIQEQLKKLIELSEKKSKANIKKLNADRALQSLTIFEKNLEQVGKNFGSWEQAFKKIICALERKEENGSCDSESSSASSSQAPQASTGGAEGSKKAKQSLEEVKAQLKQMSQYILQIQSLTTKKKEQVSLMKTFENVLSASLETLLKSISTTESFVHTTISSISSTIKELFQYTEDLTNEINKINKKLEELKKTISMVKDYEGKFLNSLCSLKTTIKPSECTTKDNS